MSFFGDVTGGQASLILNQEVRLPIWRLFRGVGFIDAGNVFDGVGDLSLTALKVALGLGVRAETPVGLFRLDYGVPLSRSQNDPRGRWFASLGQAF
ncbi:MAG: BamA/TamA family outer membrane protein [Acidobacteria bacterium]|nr:BamA/TamA family outer membrane protein [Acidobacteriota bacterium]